MKIGVMVESFRRGLAGGLDAAAELGADGVQVHATSGETHPDALDRGARAELKRRIADRGLDLSALCGDFGGHGFQIEADNARRVEDSKRVMDLAVELDCRVVTTHVGVIPADRDHPRYGVLARACRPLAEHGRAVGATFAIETGPEPADVLRAFLDDVAPEGGMGVNFDPANLVMVLDADIPASVETLGRTIVHTHAKDGVMLKPADPERLYGACKDPAERQAFGDYIEELPLGEGKVPWPAYLEALRSVGFDGYLTIEREVGADPHGDIARAVSFLKGRLAR